MKTGRCIGLVGGLGVGAAVHYYSHLAQAHQRHGALLNLVMAHAEVSQGIAFVRAGNRAGLADYLAGFVRRLAAAGAEFAVIPAVTPHFCIGELRPISSLPILSIFDPLLDHLEQNPVRKAAVLGTRFVMESDLFGRLPSVEFIHPQPDELSEIDRIYLELAATGRGSAEAHTRLTELALTFLSRDGADVILLAGTDLSLVFNNGNTEFPAIDLAALHIGAILSSSLTTLRGKEGDSGRK
jgi:aspartate racemase